MEGSKLQLDTWEAIWWVVYTNQALPAIVDIKASGLINYSYMSKHLACALNFMTMYHSNSHLTP